MRTLAWESPGNILQLHTLYQEIAPQEHFLAADIILGELPTTAQASGNPNLTFNGNIFELCAAVIDGFDQNFRIALGAQIRNPIKKWK